MFFLPHRSLYAECFRSSRSQASEEDLWTFEGGGILKRRLCKLQNLAKPSGRIWPPSLFPQETSAVLLIRALT